MKTNCYSQHGPKPRAKKGTKTPSEKDLMDRATADNNAIGGALSDIGVYALASVIDGRVEPSQALWGLQQLKDLMLDHKGDLADRENVMNIFKRSGIDKDVDFDNLYSTRIRE